MTVKITKPSINVREKLSELDKETGIKGEELLRADTSAEAREALQLDQQLFTDFESTGIDDNATSTAVTIDSANNVGIGTSSPFLFSSVQAGLTLSGISGSFPTRAGALSFISQDTTSTECHIHARDAYMAFETGTSATSAERMRLDSSGNVLFGVTSLINNGSYFKSLASNLMQLNIGSTTTTTQNVVVFRNPNAAVGTISTNASATAYNTSSDQRLKENIADAEDAGSKVDAIQVRQFDWKADGSHQDYGMVAQELLTVAPEAVSVPEDPEDMMGVDYSKLVPMLIKEIQSLRNRVATLEGN
jgi:hypothetical protein